jgi:hypothetical protein
MPDVFALYVAAHRHALRQLITGADPVEVQAAADGLRYLDPTHPAISSLCSKAESLRTLASSSTQERSDAA